MDLKLFESASQRLAAAHAQLRRPTLLVIEDEPAQGRAYARELADLARVVVAGDTEEALAAYEREQPALVISDSIGLDAVRMLRATGASVPVVLVSGGIYHPLALRGLALSEVLPKPVAGQALRELVTRWMPRPG